ncbi:hypothetical protein N7495_008132 [Penicillium taxi]|uniref:uncharacterized protein n=1 Tax=Penicillium taxi TaxID=168475 RepID=UPI002544F49D|nr:uncharacterized protein N7495_008132 [Penicillium taxi]KAJ5888091.1 hypothetical protein N7495_008132 [Penicillium taxi]
MNTQAKAPNDVSRPGRSVHLEPLNPSHITDLYESIGSNAELWTFVPDGPFNDKDSFHHFIAAASQAEGVFIYALIDQPTKKALGVLMLMHLDLKNRSVEVGIIFSPLLQRTTAATEALYLLSKTVFDDLGFRRFEWKCCDTNESSKRAAARYGFTREGVFRQHMIVKGRNRDTVWYSMIDSEWPAFRKAYESWLDPANFDDQGRQRQSLASFRA